MDSFYVMDKGYLDFGRLYLIELVNAYFVTRAKDNLAFERVYSHPVDKQTGLQSDQTIKLSVPTSAKAYPIHMRRIKYHDKELKLERSLYEILQILSVSIFDKTPVNQLVMTNELQCSENNIHN